MPNTSSDPFVPAPPLPSWKRAFDIFCALGMMVILAPFFVLVIILMTVRRDFPFFYISERMKSVDVPFQLVKFRTMRPPSETEVNTGVSGGDKDNRVTETGRLLRKFRLDETPQLWNILKGDMSFVGPRPPLRRYTESHRAIYREVLKNRPGVTGLATLMFHRHEAWLLSGTKTAEETEEIYMRRCIPRKARIDLLYQKHASLKLDLFVILATFSRRVRKLRKRC